MNHHIAKVGIDKPINNLSKDLSDSVVLFHVLNRLDPVKCPLDGIDDEDLNSRA